MWIVLKALDADKVIYRGRPDKEGKFRIFARPGRYRAALEVREPRRNEPHFEPVEFRWQVPDASRLYGGGENPHLPGHEVEIEVMPRMFTEVGIVTRTGDRN
jgi:hypothetical protein